MEDSLITCCLSHYQQIRSAKEEEQRIQTELSSLKSAAASGAESLKPAYAAKIAACDEEISRLEIYVSAARRYGTVTGYTPVAQNVPDATLQQLYTMLDPDAAGRQAAVELQKKCANARKYYETEKKRLADEWQRKKDNLNLAGTGSPRAKDLQNRLAQIRHQYEDLATGATAQQLAARIRRKTKAFGIAGGAQYRMPVSKTVPADICLGLVHFPYPLPQVYGSGLKATFGNLYNAASRSLLVPVSIPDGLGADRLYRNSNISVTYDDSTRNNSHIITHGLLFNILRHYPPMGQRVTFLDLDTFNPEHLGYMKKFVGQDKLIVFPEDSAKAKSALLQLQAAAAAEPEHKRQRRFLIIRGLGSGHSDVGNLAKTLCNNYRKNNITTIFIDRQPEQGSALSGFSTDFHITSKAGTFVTNAWGAPLRFGFFASPGGLDPATEAAFQAPFQPKQIDNKYESFFPLNKAPGYLTAPRKREQIVLPYGINEKTGNVASFTFEDMNFSAFLMGGSGSGKTTLIHALIAGIICRYHPDEVELWLADFKEAGFAPYENHMPPHIRYILMDASADMVCDFIDRLHAELSRRKSLLKSAADRLDTPVERYMPAVFVIIDEFAAISNIIKERPTHQGRLSDLMTQGRSLGFRFIFSSQGFNDGASALAPLAKGMIRSRIAMAHQNKEEIKGVLGISGATDAVSHLINNLQPHYILFKESRQEGFHLRHCLGLYFPGKQLDAWKSRYALFDYLRSKMKPVPESQYDPKNPLQYVDKKPVVCGSAALSVFRPDRFDRQLQQLKQRPDCPLFDGDLVVCYGHPRSLSRNLYTYLTPSSRENIFLLGNQEETVCTMSVILSAIRSVRRQKGQVQVWGHRTNPIFRSYRNSHFAKLTVAEGKEDICDAMVQMARDIQNHKKAPGLIVLLGMERILEEIADDAGFTPFDIPVHSPVRRQYNTAPKAPPVPASQQPDSAKLQLSEDEADAFRKMLQLPEEVAAKGAAEGKSARQIQEELAKRTAEAMQAQFGTDASVSLPEEEDPDTIDLRGMLHGSSTTAATAKKNDYAKLFRSLIEHGSRYGYHFLLCVNDYQLLKDMGLNLKLFNHRVSFRTDSRDTSSLLFNTVQAANLPAHTCLYQGFGSTSGRFMITPYLHRGVTWDQWTVDENGNAHNPDYI